MFTYFSTACFVLFFGWGAIPGAVIGGVVGGFFGSKAGEEHQKPH